MTKAKDLVARVAIDHQSHQTGQIGMDYLNADRSIIVVVDLSGGNTRSVALPVGFRAFVAAALASAPLSDPPVDDSATVAILAAHEAGNLEPNIPRDPFGGQPAASVDLPAVVEWPSGTAPTNMGDCFTMFVCKTGNSETMLFDAHCLAELIKTRFPSLHLYRLVSAGLPHRM